MIDPALENLRIKNMCEDGRDLGNVEKQSYGRIS